MQLNRAKLSGLLVFILCITSVQGFTQLGFSFDIKKPEQYDDRVLGSEKSESKKFTLPRRFFQNTFTHYNYFFNANNKLNEVLANAKTMHKDDYTELLSFYNYSLDDTQADSLQLDSVIYKSSTGIVLHDLRNDWIDNLYLLTGAAYYLRKQFDSAYLTFQFINYAFADKEKDGYYKTIGSNLDGNNAFSIATREKRSLPKKIFSEPPSRNDAFIWLTRTLIAAEEYAEAASLIVTLREDPSFPKRLKNDLEEIQAWWFYRNNMYDSAALHLSMALDNATTKLEKARWEFLVAQLYELSHKTDLAIEFYEKAISHTTDPVMEIYARLNAIRINKEGGENNIDRNIAELLKMARRDKYIDYRDVIYFTLAQMELDRGNIKTAQAHLLKSTANNTDNRELKNKAWVQLAELAFAESKYRFSHNYYDSVDLYDPLLKNKEKIEAIKPVLNKIATQIEIIERQDSLLRIAAMPEDERRDFVRKLVRQLRKQQGLKEEPSSMLVPIGDKKEEQTDLFASNSSKGEWYFYNVALKKNGQADFKARWGNRPNADNWRRQAGISFAQVSKQVTDVDNTTQPVKSAYTGPTELTFESLYESLPLTEDQKKIALDSVSTALFLLGKALAEDVEDCRASVLRLEELRQRFPDHEKMPEVLFMLVYCYDRNGESARAEAIKKLLKEKYEGTPQAVIIATGKNPGDKTNNPDATAAYEEAYDLFISGDYTNAIQKKQAADKQFGPNHWTPQLLYIEAVYYIRERDDSSAYESLNRIISNFPGTPMAEKAATLSDVLSRRQQIEEELKNLQVERPVETAPKLPDTSAIVKTPPINRSDNPAQSITVTKDSIKTVSAQPSNNTPPPATGAYKFSGDEKHQVILFMNKTDMVWVNEARNAFNIFNRGRIYNRQFTLTTFQINADYRALLIGPFDKAQDAFDYIQLVKPLSPSQIIPWLKADKYNFSVISDTNLDLLKSQQDVEQYRQMVLNFWPGKF